MRHQPHESVQDRLHPQRQRLLDDETADRRVAIDRRLRHGAAESLEVAHFPPRGGRLVGQEGGDTRLGAAQLAERQLPGLPHARLNQEAAHAEERQTVQLLPPRRLVPIGHGVGKRAIIVSDGFREGRLEGQRPRRRRPRALQTVPAPRPVRAGHLAQIKPQPRRRQARSRRGDRHPPAPQAPAPRARPIPPTAPPRPSPPPAPPTSKPIRASCRSLAEPQCPHCSATPPSPAGPRHGRTRHGTAGRTPHPPQAPPPPVAPRAGAGGCRRARRSAGRPAPPPWPSAAVAPPARPADAPPRRPAPGATAARAPAAPPAPGHAPAAAPAHPAPFLSPLLRRPSRGAPFTTYHLPFTIYHLPSRLLGLRLAEEPLGLRHAQAAGGQRLGVERLGGGEAFGPRRGRPCESPGEKLLDQMGGGGILYVVGRQPTAARDERNDR